MPRRHWVSRPHGTVRPQGEPRAPGVAPHPGVPGPDLDAGFAKIRRAAGLPEAYPAVAEREIADPWVGRERRDLTGLPWLTLDPAGSRDLDQALYLEKNADAYVVHYAIADVAAFVPPGGALDAETHRRAMTVYCPDVRVPLHPVRLGEGAGSLLPGKVRPAVAWRIVLDGDGQVRDVDVARAVVRSRSRHSYAEAQLQLDAALTDGPAGETGEQWVLLREIGERRRALERARGGVSLDLPEQEVVRSAGAWKVELRAAAPIENDNAQISLLTGMVAARLMLDGRVGVLRTMPPAPPERLDWLRWRAQALGIAWHRGERYGEVLARSDPRTPAGAAFQTAAASLFRGASWVPFDGTPPPQVTHAAIAAPYAHVTAPLRRLVDRYSTEVCLALAAGRSVPLWVTDAFATLAEAMEAGARRDSSVDRACTDLVEAAILQGRLGERFAAVAITERNVQIAQPAVQAPCTAAGGRGLVPGESLTVVLTRASLDPPEVRFAEALPPDPAVQSGLQGTNPSESG